VEKVDQRFWNRRVQNDPSQTHYQQQVPQISHHPASKRRERERTRESENNAKCSVYVLQARTYRREFDTIGFHTQDIVEQTLIMPAVMKRHCQIHHAITNDQQWAL
jgi:hypothetical protein